MIKKAFKMIKIVEREKEELNQEYKTLREKNYKRSTEVKRKIEHKSNDFASRKVNRENHFNFLRNK